MFGDLLSVVVLIFIAPIILVGFVLKSLIEEANLFLRLPVLGGAVSIGNLGFLALINSKPDPAAKFNTLMEVFGQAHPFGIPMPHLCFAISAVLFIAAPRWKKLGVR